MQARIRTFFSTSFGSAVLGGLVVGLLGWIAIAAGWIEADDGGGQIAGAPLTRPVSDQGNGNLTVSEIYERDSEGVAFVEAQRTERVVSPFDLFPQEQQSTASGSGFVIDAEGHVLTNAHVVQGAQQIRVTLGEGDPVEAKLVGADPSTDIALLDVEADAGTLQPVELGDSSDAKVGDPVVAIGNPFGLERTVTSGIVSAIQREISAPNGFSISNVIQTDAPINPGNSGGPLLDAQGRVIGINSQIETGGTGGGSVGIGFAVPIDTAEEVVEELLRDGEVKHAYLGVEGSDHEQGAEIQVVQPGSPADKAGIAAGDLVVKVNGEDVDAMEDVIGAINDADPGDQLELRIIHDGEETDVTVTLGERPTEVQGQAGP